MRGLNVRVEYANAKIAEIVDPNSDAMCFALNEAEAEGYRDYHARLDSVPVMFADVPGLVTAWQSGQNFAADCEEMENCPYCKAAHGDPCPVHG
ncbi:hypothetical protein BLA23254_08048 [Burkholderia lata]|uniref:Uncharacterized protein n=1 Tax=Burkholderia lata (strain ATCC 17760 / DSM 23089 / LMG 22485 / NCIMB 9086 / R18194 / 383) TaxID=482957 RepID=A0A6P2SWD0_BURL3|nr:hypothetical protein [Burkholderia lata]VWC52650.1 hypothetical protein BLA23254_08048 [Burkholderia lata]